MCEDLETEGTACERAKCKSELSIGGEKRKQVSGALREEMVEDISL